MTLLEKLNRKIGRFSIPRLMIGLSAIMLVVYLVALFEPRILTYLVLDRDLLFQGQVWRLITFLFVPPDSSPVWLLLSLYFYCLIGNTLENQWGSFRFNLFYLCGAVGAILASLITGYGTNEYLNLSLFFAFAALFPDYQILLFFFLPIKVKWLALLDGLLYVYLLIIGTWTMRAAILMSLINVILFFGGGLIRHLRQQSSYWKTRRNYRRYNR